MKFSNSCRNLLLSVTLILMKAQAQLPNTVPQNKYGLPVINTLTAYRKTVLADTNNRMVPVNQYVSPLLTDWKYATTDNFTKTILYKAPVALVRLPVAKALHNIQLQLAGQGLTLLFYDAYRPYAVTEKMWEIVPDERYAANPAKGSGHNRGIAVDVTLASLKTGRTLTMPTPFDDFTEKAHHSYNQLDSITLVNRALLKKVMEDNGFTALATEWWHYYYAKGSFALLNLPFGDLVQP